MYATSDFLCSLETSVALGKVVCTLSETSRITVVTIKKNNNMKTISGSDAVDMPGVPFFLPGLNLDILLLAYSNRFCFRNSLRKNFPDQLFFGYILFTFQ